MFRYALIIGIMCIGFRADAQAVWDSLLNETRRMKDAWDMPAMLRISRYSDSMLSLETNPDSFYLCAFRHQEGDALYNLGRYTEAITAFNRALKVSGNAPRGLNQRGKILYDRAFSEYELQYYKQSYQSVIESETILSTLENPDYDYLLSVYADLCFQGVDLGYLKDAEKYLKKGEKLFQRHKDEVIYLNEEQSRKEALFEYNYVLLYSESGEEEKLLIHINKMKTLKKRLPFNQGEQYMFAVGLNHVADFYLNFSDWWDDNYPFVQAERYLREAFEALDKDQYPENFVQFTYNQNKAYRKSGKYDLALQGNDYLLSIADSNDYRMPFFIVQRGLIYAASGQKENAIQAFRRIAELIHTGTEPLSKDYSNFQPSTTVNHADLFAGVMDEFLESYPEDKEVQALAAELYPLALQQFEFAYQHSTFNPKLREFYDKILNGILSTRIRENGTETIALSDLLTKIEDIENRLAWQEHLLNRRFNELKIPDSLLYKEMELRSKIASAKQENAPELEVFEWEDRLAKFERNLQERYPAHAHFVKNAFDLKELQNQISPETLILRYKKASDNFYLFAISKQDIQYVELGEKEEIVPEIQAILAQIENRGNIAQSSFLDRFIPLEIASFQHLIIIPDGELHDLPFEVLSKESQFLIETHTISYATHLVFVESQLEGNGQANKTIHFMAFSPTYGDDASGLAMRNQANRLQGAHQEVRAVTQVFGGELYEGKMASKAQFMGNAGKANILHLAMHADIHNDQPKLSYLLFSPASDDDKMYVEELYGLNLRADLAVLSACNTGKGSLDERRGMVSLHRAFCYAGVPATVASLWAVPDKATQEIMTVFYEKLKTGLSKDEALQQAKLTYIRENDDPHFRHPFFWAGFVLYGDTDPVQLNTKPDSMTIIWLFGLVVLVGGVGFFLRKKRN